MYCRTRPLGGYFGISADQIAPDPGPVINPRDDNGGEEVQDVPRREDGGGHRHGGLQGVQEGIQLGLFFESNNKSTMQWHFPEGQKQPRLKYHKVDS